MMALDMVRIEADMGVVFDIQTLNDVKDTTVIINSTNVYTLKEPDMIITKITFKGIKLNAAEIEDLTVENEITTALMIDKDYILVDNDEVGIGFT